MEKLIDLNNYPVSVVLKQLLKDKTTKKNIIFATSAYSSDDKAMNETDQITEEFLMGFGFDSIQPRVTKSIEAQTERTRKKAEVFV